MQILHVATPNKAAYLNWISGMVGMDAKDKAVGPSIALRVSAGDKVDMETWTRYEKKVSYTRNITTLMLSQFLGAGFAYSTGFDGSTIVQTGQAFNGALAAGGFMGDGSDGSKPFAYLNYIVFDQNMAYITGSYIRVPTDAGFNAGEEGLPNMHKRIGINQPLTIAQNGFIYIWVSNESENTKVWFDDLKITHTSNLVTQATDYGVWGDVLREQKSDESKYRFGYQGQYAEKDEETGWNHFELREYDPIIGRWLVPDPMNEFWSPYLAMGNNPVNGVDPNGGCTGDCDYDPASDPAFHGDYELTITADRIYDFTQSFSNIPQAMDATNFVMDKLSHTPYTEPKPWNFNLSRLSVISEGGTGSINVGSGKIDYFINADDWSPDIDLQMWADLFGGKLGVEQKMREHHEEEHKIPVPVGSPKFSLWGNRIRGKDGTGEFPSAKVDSANRLMQFYRYRTQKMSDSSKVITIDIEWFKTGTDPNGH